MQSLAHVVAGIDVGGQRKGFHGVALREGQYWKQFASSNPSAMADWCRNEVRAIAIGIDAPCRWSSTGRARPAERELAKELVNCFATPSREAAESNPFYAWMRNGAALFAAVEPDYPLFIGQTLPTRGPVCFETFPQAVACALAGERVSAKQKSSVRRKLLVKAGIKIDNLKNIDTVDAALCALAAHYLQMGKYRAYGELESGFIVVPLNTN